ncbi:MAG: hypothetical protein GX115_09560 [Ruminiclostridium sp.]|nr:hypothetical protein [Ruminiclostridium sp.]
MNRSIRIILSMLMVAMLLTGCGNKKEPTPKAELPTTTSEPSTQPSEPSTQPGEVTNPPGSVTNGTGWSGYFGTFTHRESSQYNNSTLQIKALDEAVVLFEIDMMEGSESEDQSRTLIIAGTMYIEDRETGIYECIREDGSTAYSISFSRSGDGQVLTVTHTGDIPMDPDGSYDYVDSTIEADADLSITLLENLPTAATSLNSTSSTYTIQYPDESVLNYFYPVTATFDDTGATLASYLVTDDLSAVWRLDTEDNIPVLIYGTAQDMLDQVVYLEPDEDEDSDAEISYEAMPLLPVIVEGGMMLTPGTMTKLIMDSPYPFPFTFEQLLSTDEAIATLDENGVITAHSAGSVTITGHVTLEDGRRSFMLDLVVGAEGEAGEVQADDVPSEDAVG